MASSPEPNDRTAAPDASPWEARLCAVGELPAVGTSIAREIEGRTIAIFNIDSRLYAIDDLCTHAHSSLSADGSVCGLVVECALHRAQFNISTGRAMGGPTRKHLRTYALRVAGDHVVAVEKPKFPIGEPS